MSIDRPSIATSRCTGDSADSLAGRREDPEDMPGAITVHIFGQSSMGNGASNIDGGIIALNCTTAAFVLNSGHAYSVLHCSHRSETTARPL